jgi:hypothetical protein
MSARAWKRRRNKRTLWWPLGYSDAVDRMFDPVDRWGITLLTTTEPAKPHTLGGGQVSIESAPYRDHPHQTRVGRVAGNDVRQTALIWYTRLATRSGAPGS